MNNYEEALKNPFKKKKLPYLDPLTEDRKKPEMSRNKDAAPALVLSCSFRCSFI